MDEAVQQAAERLRQAGTLRRPCLSVHRLLLGSREAAYAVEVDGRVSARVSFVASAAPSSEEEAS